MQLDNPLFASYNRSRDRETETETRVRQLRETETEKKKRARELINLFYTVAPFPRGDA